VSSEQTKPIDRRRLAGRHTLWFRYVIVTVLSPAQRPVVQTNPIPRRRPAGRGGQLYKRTQSWLPCRSGDRHGREVETCETKPMGGGVSSWKAVGVGPRACPSGGWPRGAAPTEPAAQPQSCQTNPTGAGSGLVPWEESGCQGPTRTNEVGRGRPSYEETPGGLRRAQSSRVTRSTPAGQLCETKPMGPEPDMTQVLCGTEVRSVSAREGLEKTNPIGSAPRGTDIPAVSLDHGEESRDIHGQDARDTHGRDAHATGMTEPGGTEAPVGQLCETNPMGRETDTSQVMGCTAVRSASASQELRKTNPIGRGVSSWECQVSGKPGPAGSPPGLPTSNFTLYTSHSAEGRSCQTKPIGGGG
jgi:hypothetical protein